MKKRSAIKEKFSADRIKPKVRRAKGPGCPVEVDPAPKSGTVSG